MKKQPVPVFRITISSYELSSAIEDLNKLKASNNIHPDSIALLAKLQMLAIKNQMGIANPSYIQTGRVGVSSSDMMSMLSDNGNGNHNQHHPSKPKTPDVIIDRRNQGINIHNYTQEQIEDAQFAASDYFIEHGVKKDWHEFLPKPVVINERRHIESNNIEPDDKELADELFKKL